MIDPGLSLLLRLTLRGMLRAWWRRLRTLKGALIALAVAPFALLFVAAQVNLLLFMPPEQLPRFSAADVRLFLPPMALLLLLIEVLSGRVLAFKPAELDFLFPAPVTRRQLLAYHLLSRAPVRMLSALWFALFMARTAGHPVGGLLAPILVFALIHVATTLIALLAAAAEAWAGRWASRVGWAAAGGLVLWGAARAVHTPAGLGAGLRAAMDTPGIRAVTFPLRPFAEIYTATSAPQVLQWTALSLVLVGLATSGVFALDVAYADRAAAASRRALARLRRAGAGHAVGIARPWKLRLRVPAPAFLGRGAPLAWRQTLELARNPRALTLPLVLPGMYLLLFLAMPVVEGRAVPVEMAVAAIAISVAVPLLMPNVGFDFRRDVDRMATLRALPLRPSAVAVGQLFAPTLAFVIAQVAVVLAVSLATRAISPVWLLAVLALGAPLTWGVVALDNLLFLWMPYRFSPDGQQNAQFAGKAMLALVVKLIVVLMMAGVAGVAAYLAYAATGGSSPAAVVAAALMLAACCAPLTWAVGAAFRGFDLVTDVPA